MTDQIKGVVITENKSLVEALALELRPILNTLHTVRYDETAYQAIKKLRPETVFVSLTQETQRDFDLIRRLIRHIPESRIFILARDKNPDLILEGLRTGVADYIVFPGSNGSVLNAVQKNLKTGTGRSGELIALFSLKGGQGVTSLSVNLADHLSTLTGDNVLLTDLNLYRGDVGTCLNMSADYTVFDLIKDVERMDRNLLFSSITRHANGFHVLTSPDEISDADQVTGDDVRRMLVPLLQYMDYVVVDLPHDFSERSLAVMNSADKVLLVTQQSLPVTKSVQRTLELFQDLNYNFEEKIRIVVNRHNTNGEFTSDDLGRIFNQPVFATITNDYRSAMQAIDKGKPIGTVREKTRINRDLRRLTRRLIGSAAAGLDRQGKMASLRSWFDGLTGTL